LPCCSPSRSASRRASVRPRAGHADGRLFQHRHHHDHRLAAKNAILIVEYAKDLNEQGEELVTATLHAVRLRFRPILMTSLAFILGVLPLVISSGAGAGGRNALGTGVMGGMISATILGLFFVPVFFVVIRAWLGRRSAPKETQGPTGGELAHA
jgi:predicted RND superfamily exporter protein